MDVIRSYFEKRNDKREAIVSELQNKLQVYIERSVIYVEDFSMVCQDKIRSNSLAELAALSSICLDSKGYSAVGQAKYTLETLKNLERLMKMGEFI